MSVERVDKSNRSLVELLQRAEQEPLILQTEAGGDFALLPLDDSVIDLLLERSPRLIAECDKIRERMARGTYLTHQQVLEALKD